MKKGLTIILLFAVAGMLACKVKSTNTSDSATNQAKNTYDYRVSFLSKGGGIDLETFRSYKSFLESYSPSVDYTQVSWGKEGEKGYCINLSSWDKQAIDAFKSESSKILNASDKVEINGIDRCK